MQLNTKHMCFVVSVTALAVLNSSAGETIHVWTNSASDGPGRSWGDAYHTIQGAVDVAGYGDTVLVTNGIYDCGGADTPGGNDLANRVCITNSITVLSVNGPDVTIIRGEPDSEGGSPSNGPAAVRGVFMSDASILGGFTITNGYTMDAGDYYYDQSGGGLWLGTNCLASNLVVCGNSAGVDGGGVFCGGALNNCTLKGNRADNYGGGVSVQKGAEVRNCRLSMNTAGYYGGGAFVYSNGLVSNCIIRGNSVDYFGGGGVYLFKGGTLSSSTLSGNSAGNIGSDGGGCFLYRGGSLINCILQGNSADGTGNDIYDDGADAIRYTCASDGIAHGIGGCITNDPLFVSLDSPNYHLQSGSPCIDTGTNDLTSLAFDLDGIGRPLDGNNDGDSIIDMGCYEHLTSLADSDGDQIPDGWEHDSGLNPASSNAPSANADSDPFTDIEEYIADTQPTDEASYFAISSITHDSPLTVHFTSSTNRLYTLKSCSSILAPTWTAVPGQGPREGVGAPDLMIDTNSVDQSFYRIQVELP